jgi:hypothetical protein
MIKCKICNSESRLLFNKTILNKYAAGYYQCSDCGFMQTSEPVWLKEAYDSAITALDIGLVERNLVLRDEVSALIDKCFPAAASFLDYAGGYGLFVRMMRDRGYPFIRQDLYCENLFAKYFDIEDSAVRKFDIVTAFEVFEHLTDPVGEIEKIISYAPVVVFSTKLVPETGPIADWWYLSPETGQHVAFFTKRALELLAQRFKRHYYNNGQNLHIFTVTEMNEEQFMLNEVKPRWWERKKESPASKPRRSLLEDDYRHIQEILKKTKG